MTLKEAKPRTARIFLAEDNEADIFLIRKAFRQHGVDCELEIARNGEDALSMLTDASRVTPDLVLLDVNLPCYDGFAVLRAVRERSALADTPVVIMTSSDSHRDREEAAELGVRKFIHKPSHLADFLSIGPIVKEILGSQGTTRTDRTPPPLMRTPQVPIPAPTPRAAVPETSAPAPPPTAVRAAAPPPPTAVPQPPSGPQPSATVRVSRDPEPASAPRPKRIGMSSRIPRRLAVGSIVATVLVACAAFAAYAAIERTMLADLRKDLESRVAETSNMLRVWFDLESTTAGVIASRRTVREGVATLATLAANEAPEAASRGAARPGVLDDALAAPMAQAGFEDYVLIAPNGRILVENRGVGSSGHLHDNDRLLLEEVLRGESRLLDGRSFVGVTDPVSARGAYVAVPVHLSEGRPIAALALKLSLGRFIRLVSSARVGDTGETYVFDRVGVFLSESRFEDQLRAAGLLGVGESSSLKLEGRAPGGDITKGFRPAMPMSSRPMTHAVSHALNGAKGADVVPFLDYRGVEVVGAWDWLPELNLGISTKMDATEALAGLTWLKIAFWSVLGVAALAGTILIFGSIRSRAAANPSEGQVGPYTLAEKIGEGAMGTVYRATHATLRRPVAIKLLEARESKAIQRFEREVQLTSVLTHPSTVVIYDYGRTEEGVFYYAMEHLEGIDLADLLLMTGPLPPARVVHILRQVCGSLAEAHALRLVHRDIKPSNIMLTSRGGEADVVKVVDFGLVKPIDPDPHSKLTKDGAIFGTPGFIPPEALLDAGKFDGRGDIYALGAVAYELLAGRPPFDRGNADELWQSHLTLTPPPPSVRLGRPLPRDLEMLVLRMLAKDPARRPQSANELRDLLDACTDCGTWTQAQARAWWKAQGEAAASSVQHRNGDPDSTRRFGPEAGA